MTTFYDFIAQDTPFRFNPTLDGATYSAVILWELFGQRWYLKLTDLNGNLITFTAIVSSSTGQQVQSASWSRVTNTVTLTLALPHRIPLGSIADLTVSDAIPDVYNGRFRMTAATPLTLTYTRNDDPGATASNAGSVGRYIDLVAGYFDTSTLVFRKSTQRFEVSP